MIEQVSLSVDGARHYGWTEVRITRSLDYVAHSFELTLTDKWSDGNNAERRTILPGMPCQVHASGELLISGFVDEVVPAYSKDSHSLRVIGRSKVGDLVDCSLEGKAYRDQTLLQIATAEAQAFGIGVAQVATGDGIDTPFALARRETGQPVYEFLEELARIRAVRFVSDASGNLQIVRAGNQRASTPLALGVNIQEASGQMSLRDRYSLYQAISQHDDVDVDVSSNVQITETATDDWGRYNRYRPHTFMLETDADASDARARAEWQRNTAYGRSQGIVYAVTGWRQNDGSLWPVNAVVAINDKWMGITGQRLIAEVNFSLSADGQRTELRVLPIEAYQLNKLPDPEDPETSDFYE